MEKSTVLKKKYSPPKVEKLGKIELTKGSRGLRADNGTRRRLRGASTLLDPSEILS
jgi:hypothetical protein